MNLRKLTAFSAALLMVCTSLCACAKKEANNPSMENIAEPTDSPTEAETEPKTTEPETTEPETEPETEEATVVDDGWKEAYLDIINNLPHQNIIYEGALVYLDEDAIPEMYYAYSAFADECFGGLYTYRNGQAERIHEMTGERFYAYKEFSGEYEMHLFFSLTDEMLFWNMEEDIVQKHFQWNCDEIDSFYYINGQYVSESQYNTELKKEEQGYTPVEILTTDELIARINKGEVSTAGNSTVVPDSDTSSGGLEITPAGLKMTFSDILAQTDSSTEGFLCDLDLDGKEEMILISDAEKGFILYRYNSSGSVEEYHFGHLTSAYADVFEATGTDGSHYLYYRDEESHISRQGYFDVVNNNELHILIDYPNISTANWSIYHNDAEYETSYETVDGVYAQPDKCHASLLNAFSDCGFALVENSKYSRVTCLSYSELCSRVQ